MSENNRQLLAHELARSIFQHRDPRVSVGAGPDDCAVVNVNGVKLLVTSDFKNSSRISDRHLGSDFAELGRYTVRQNVCDVLACGGSPAWFMLSFMATKDITTSQIREFFLSVQSECRRFGVAVIGGDTKEGQHSVVCGTLFGVLDGPFWAKSNAKPGDDVYLTGPIGGVTAALCALERSDIPESRVDALAVLVETDVPLTVFTKLREIRSDMACTDISDGLGFSLHQIMKSSDVCIEIDPRLVELHPLAERISREMSLPRNAFVFGYGGDFQAVLTARRDLRSSMLAAGCVKVGNVISREHHGPEGLVVGGKEIPSFGHLDFEAESPVDRFLAYARSKVHE